MDIKKVKEAAASRSNENETKGLFKELFQNFARAGDKESDGNSISLQNVQDWMKQANITGGDKKITEKETTEIFEKVAQSSDRVDMDGFQTFLEELASNMKLKTKDLLEKMKGAGLPGAANLWKGGNTGTAAESDGSSRSDEEGRESGQEGKGGGILDSMKRATGFK